MQHLGLILSVAVVAVLVVVAVVVATVVAVVVCAVAGAVVVANLKEEKQFFSKLATRSKVFADTVFGLVGYILRL